MNNLPLAAWFRRPSAEGRHWLFILLATLSLSACQEEGLQLMLEEVPYVSVEAALPAAVVALQDSLVLRISYTDLDGDLGFLEADSAVVFITDDRFPLTETFHVPPVAPVGGPIAVTGVWDVVLDRLILADPAASSETVEFRVQIRDRAGHWSNEALSPPVTVVANP